MRRDDVLSDLDLQAGRRHAARNYVCSHVKNGTGLCNAPSVPAQRVDGYVLEHLSSFTDAAARWLHELGFDRQGAEAAAERALAGVTRLAARYARQQDLDTPRAEALLSMIGHQRSEASRAQARVTRVADELAAVRRTIAGDELESARRALADALGTGATATIAELNRILRDHFDAFVITADPKRPAVGGLGLLDGLGLVGFDASPCRI